ncbi:MAG: redoxin domain-containing protein [Pedosphaera sp.]|nr:redoxin domain-containing protein [Pedosphaera sp.]
MRDANRLGVALAGIFVMLLSGCNGDPAAAPVSAPIDGRIKLSLDLLDLANQRIDPFQTTNAKATVFIFLSTDCPISNRYAPEVQRLHAEFAPQGIKFWLIYPNHDDSSEVIRKHIQDYNYSIEPLRDPQHTLVRATKARVTPEVVVYGTEGRKVYQGRIDDRNVDFGKERPQPSRRDLNEVLDAVVNGRTVTNVFTTPVGCYIPEAP